VVDLGDLIMEYILTFVIGVICGGVIVFFLSHRKISQLQTEGTSLKTQLAEVRTELDLQKKAAVEKLALLDDARETLAETFKALAADALKSNDESFLNLAKTVLDKHQHEAKTDID
jgi:DNA recombination protein RmuC